MPVLNLDDQAQHLGGVPPNAQTGDDIAHPTDARLYETKRFVALERAAVLVPA